MDGGFLGGRGSAVHADVGGVQFGVGVFAEALVGRDETAGAEVAEFVVAELAVGVFGVAQVVAVVGLDVGQFASQAGGELSPSRSSSGVMPKSSDSSGRSGGE